MKTVVYKYGIKNYKRSVKLAAKSVTTTTFYGYDVYYFIPLKTDFFVFTDIQYSEPDSSSLVAVYVITPVIVLVVAAMIIVVYLR